MFRVVNRLLVLDDWLDLSAKKCTKIVLITGVMEFPALEAVYYRSANPTWLEQFEDGIHDFLAESAVDGIVEFNPDILVPENSLEFGEEIHQSIRDRVRKAVIGHLDEARYFALLNRGALRRHLGGYRMIHSPIADSMHKIRRGVDLQHL